jgi:DNA uptake protein ComE-like DNA-binding protein
MKGIQRHFHLSKKEVRGLLGLWVVLALMGALGLYFRRPPDVSILTGEKLVEASAFNEVQEANEIQKDSTYVCNPNTVSWKELTQLGLSDRVASSWIAWRNAGKVFHSKDDIAAVRGISSHELEMLLPHIIWNSDEQGHAVSHGKDKEDKTQIYNREDISMDDKLSPKVNLNRADQESLKALPGIGPVLSERIIRYRELLGGYYSVDQLLEVYGLRDEHFIKVEKHLYVESEEVIRMDLDSIRFRDLLRHPYASYQLTKELFDCQSEGIFIDSIETHLEDSLQLPFLKLKPYLYDHGNEKVPVTISDRAG